MGPVLLMYLLVKMGTGKSNLFEAIVEVFRHLYEREYNQVNFDYTIEYELDGADHFVRWDWTKGHWLDRQSNQTKKIRKANLPDNILLYYSGHNEKIIKLINEYEEAFKKELKEANEGDTREFIGIGKDYKALLLAVLLIQPDSCKAKKFILEKLGIKSVQNELSITLKRPYYARKKGYDVDRFDDSTRYWKAKGITQTFLDKITTVKKSESEGVRDEGYIPQGQEKYKDKYQLFLDLGDFQTTFKGTSAQELFRDFDNLKTIEMLDDISVDIELLDGTKIDVDQFSDGQFQSIYIYTIIELFKDKNCLTLLDEPDSFLHPEWQFDFLKQVFEITEREAVNNHVLMTSHSAVTLIPHEHRNINLFRFIGDDLKCHTVNKAYAIEQLSSQMIKYSEDEQILSIINQVNIEDKPILFTEGSTDPIILTTAWSKLYEEPLPVHIIFAFGCVYLRQLLQDERILNELDGSPAFGLFDFDEAYNEWNSIRGEDDLLLQDDPYLGLAKKSER
jgi:ABC-type Mn2+/Zn2+ transport system ATPase subunit